MAESSDSFQKERKMTSGPNFSASVVRKSPAAANIPPTTNSMKVCNFKLLKQENKSAFCWLDF